MNERVGFSIKIEEEGGIFVELVGLKIPLPRLIRKEKKYGDVGVNKMTFGVDDVEKLYKDFKETLNLASSPKSVKLPGWGEHAFVYGRDPEGNLLEFVSGPKIKTKNRFGGMRWAGIAVTDLERSMSFYQSMAFDEVVVSPHEAFSGMVDEVSGEKGTQVRSCLLANSSGGGMLELYECIKPRGRSIPLNNYWGDAGYLEMCLEAENIHDVVDWCRAERVYYLHKPVGTAEGGQEVWFQYIYDPDGIPVETIASMPIE